MIGSTSWGLPIPWKPGARDSSWAGYTASRWAPRFSANPCSQRPNASKVAFVHLVRQLQAWEFHLVDCQVYTEHLARFGATPWPRTRFLDSLAKALTAPMYQGPWNSRTLAPRGRGCG